MTERAEAERIGMALNRRPHRQRPNGASREKLAKKGIDMNATTTRLQARRFLFLICFACLAVAARAAGVRDIVIPADGSGPEITTKLWTPCASPPGPIRVSRGTTQLEIHGVKDCAPSGKSLPLIVISHGMLEDMFSHHDTAEYLADAGFAVVTLNHPQDSVSSSKDTVDNISSFLVRPVDIQRVITFVLSNSQATVNIDSRRIGFFGFSRGGYTGLILAGATPDFHALLFPCPEAFLMCRQIRDNEIPAQSSGYEPRIKAFVIADPISFFPNKASLQKVTAPIQLWSSERGGMGVRPEDVASVERNLPNTPEFHRPANSVHFSFLFPCSDEESKRMSFQCTDAPGFDRAEFHRQFNVQVLTFFRKNLAGNGR
jgi:predicted dienelactone hydrolase